MYINSIGNSPNFGSSFRVGIYVQTPDGEKKFISPATDKKLYTQLNSRIVSSLNDDFYMSLRRMFDVERKKNIKPLSNIYRNLIQDLKNIDPDYARFNLTRSMYRKGHLGYIITGSDVSIVENEKCVGMIGKERKESSWVNGSFDNGYTQDYSRAAMKEALQYVRKDDVLLRSDNNKEIMLYAYFKEVGTDSRGSKKYALCDYEFHENKSLPDLKPVSENHILYKQSPKVSNEIQKTIQLRLRSILGKGFNFKNIDVEKFLAGGSKESIKITEQQLKTKPNQDEGKPSYPSGTQLKIDFDA